MQIRALTLRRAWNLGLVSLSYVLARTLHRPIHWGKPVTLGIEPTTACNLRCPQCPSGLRSFTRPTGRLSVERFQALIDETHTHLWQLVLYFQGEPYLNPDFLEMVSYAHRRGLFTFSSTNAHFLTPEIARQTVLSGLSHLIVSLDGLTQETYAQYRVAGQVDKVLEGLRNLTAAKRELKSHTPFIDLQFIVFEHNRHEVEAVRALGRELGVDQVSIKTAQVYDFEQGNALIPQDGRYSRYEPLPDGTWRIRNKLLNHCWKLWQGAEITWDGRVLPCCFDKDAQHEMGRFPEQSLAQIWQSAPYRDFRARLTQGRKEIDICRNCTEGTRIWSN